MGTSESAFLCLRRPCTGPHPGQAALSLPPFCLCRILLLALPPYYPSVLGGTTGFFPPMGSGTAQLPALFLLFLPQCQCPGGWSLPPPCPLHEGEGAARELTPPSPPQQASVFRAGHPGSRLHHLPARCGPLHGLSGKGRWAGVAGGGSPSLPAFCPSSHLMLATPVRGSP